MSKENKNQSLEEEQSMNEAEEVTTSDVESEEVEAEAVVEPEVVEQDAEFDELETLKEQTEQLEDQVLRLQAEIANMRRTHTRDRQEAAKYRSANLASKLVDALDNLERALDSEIESEDGLALKKGVEMVYQQLIQGFNEENIEVVNPLNEPFDPNFEQAVSVMPAEEGVEDNTVVHVVQKGYKIDNRVIRPAMVIVAQQQ
ncbi:nucleotide exchange factor GrpE [Falseniella ignava]|uniref:Protein GrpE n=1 Tax=Falseniella ignava TaxID=137730 RepID=A0A2I1K4G7_9LACT|nr:nucleotide exchange factor GrpE [Falseniella ignava]PKY90455.1 nucleotide exchange factor GrpE [Falseniella ignava]